VSNLKEIVLLKFIDAYAISKTIEKIFDMKDNIVEEVGEENFIQVVTNNAINYKVASQMFMTKEKKAILDIVCCTLC